MSEYEELMGADYIEHKVGTFAQRAEELQKQQYQIHSPGRIRSTSFSGMKNPNHKC